MCGGRPVVRGTRIPVQTIVGYYKQGLSVDEILAGLPHLTEAQVFAALSYYHDHQAEIEADIVAAEPEPLLARYGLRMEPDGRVVPVERRWLNRQARPYAGIIVSKQHPIRETIRRLLGLLNHVTAGEMQNQFWWI